MLTHPDILPETYDEGELMARQRTAQAMIEDPVFRHCVATAQMEALTVAMTADTASLRDEARHLFNALQLVMDKMQITVERGEHAEAKIRKAEDDGTPS